jgi:hypothetical protein
MSAVAAMQCPTAKLLDTAIITTIALIDAKLLAPAVLARAFVDN